MSENNENTNVIEAISEDELETVAGGNRVFANAKEEKKAKEQAAADGRTHMVRAGNWMCVCSHKYKFAREKVEQKRAPQVTFYDIKCYYCGATKDQESWTANI